MTTTSTVISSTVAFSATTADPTSALALGAVTLAIFVLLYVWTALALSAVFGKSGVPGWKAWVPFLNTIVLLQLGGLSGWLVLIALVPVLGALVVWVLIVIACSRVNAAFGFGAAMTVLAALSLPIWASVLGFGSARWIGEPEYADDAAHVGGARRAAVGQYASTTPLDDPLAQRLRPANVAGRSAAASAGAPVPAIVPAPPFSESHANAAFDFGAVGELTGDVTDAVPGAPAPVSAVRPAPAVPPISSVPLASFPAVGGDSAPARPTPPPVTRVPAASPARAHGADDPWAPPRSATREREESQRFPESSAEVSAIDGAPDAGSPRSARGSVAGQHTRSEIPDEPVDETIITRRGRTAWLLTAPAGTPVPISSQIVILGRRPSIDPAFPGAQLVVIDDGTVSKTHARLELRGDRWYITDLGSTNGVLFATLMGTEVEATPGVEVEAGERFYLGDAEVRLQRSDG